MMFFLYIHVILVQAAHEALIIYQKRLGLKTHKSK